MEICVQKTLCLPMSNLTFRWFPENAFHLILQHNGNLICKNKRRDALEAAFKKKYQVAILDDGLQEKIFKYNKFIISPPAGQTKCRSLQIINQKT